LCRPAVVKQRLSLEFEEIGIGGIAFDERVELALQERGRPVPALMTEGDWSARSGYEAGRAMLAETLPGTPLPTAVFAANDQMALGLLRALDEAGLRVPQDVSVVGFDDTPESGYFTPPLTTVRQDLRQLGQLTMALVLRVLAGELDAAEPLVKPLLIIRSSTAAPRSDTPE